MGAYGAERITSEGIKSNPRLQLTRAGRPRNNLGSCKEGTIGNAFPKQWIVTKHGTCIIAVLGTGISNNCHIMIAVLAVSRLPEAQALRVKS